MSNLLYYIIRGQEMAIKLKLNSKEILEMKFPNVPRGYDPLYVDEYLDKIIRDYKVVETNYLLDNTEIAAYKDKINALEIENNELKISISKYESRLKYINDNDNVSMDNIDLVRRINQLEKFLYNHGYMPDKIK